MKNISSFRHTYDYGSMKIDRDPVNIFDETLNAVHELHNEYLKISKEKRLNDANIDLERDRLHILENGKEIAVVRNAKELNGLPLTGEQKDYILMHNQKLEAFIMLESHKGNKGFVLGSTIGKNRPQCVLDITRDSRGILESVSYSRTRSYGYGTAEDTATYPPQGKTLDHMVLQIKADISQLGKEALNRESFLPKLEIEVHNIDHTKQNRCDMLCSEKVVLEDKAEKSNSDSLKSFLKNSFLEKVSRVPVEKEVSEIFYETFELLVTNDKERERLRDEGIELERAIKMENGELNTLDTIKYYLNKIIEKIFGSEKVISNSEREGIKNNFTERIKEERNLQKDFSPSK